MKAETKFDEVYKELSSIRENELSFNEADTVRFVKSQIQKMVSNLSAMEKASQQKEWDELLGNFLQLLEKINLINVYLMQPTSLSMLMKERIADVVEKLISSISFSISEAVLMIKEVSKEMGVENINISVSGTPATINVSISMKKA
ncbi:hypothetical protein [Sulfuracidifex tepidarius]|uniref:Uncharacterized protein n=1 Tax=Sulfuracidifex tepidarius TaxID=1294262 RepID=A0A510E6L3_9CREN|nr:hypothetical protein [Sulfuracidifex tepidarius]BBG25379.1 hypothetical protein IC006_2714 [Sulfuracidifex tepidarius]BBG28173.1 hypothetical protein IC007_2728 [Sulfuracidifex tepidarius]